MNNKGNLRKLTEFCILSTAIVTLALTGCGGGGGGGGSAPAAVVVSTFASASGSPAYIASDGTNLYVTDAVNNNIRKIVIATGQATTFAGSTTGASGYIDNTASSVARFNQPMGIATDSTNLYVVDSSNNSIRQIVISTGAVTTIAGDTTGASGVADGTGTNARFNGPVGISLIGASLYVADSSNCTIRKINSTASAVVSTPMGTASTCGYTNGSSGASSVFNTPKGLTTDGTSLFVVESGNNDVRKIDVATGSTTLVAGYNLGAGSSDGIGTNARFNNPFGITTDGTNLYVSDTNNHTIRKIVIATGTVSTPAGAVLVFGATDGTGPNARFNHPFGIIYLNGALYVADYTNGSIRKIQL